MRTSITLSIIALFAAWTGCTAPNTEVAGAKSTGALTIPELPKRVAEFGDPAEYDHLLDQYDRAKIRLRKDANDENALLRLAEVFITDARITGHYATDHDAAITILDHLIATKTKPDTREQAYALKATIRLTQHEFADALTLGQEAVKIDPHRAFNYGILVDANTELGNYDEAVRLCDKMVGIRPDLRSYSRVSYQREIHGDIPGAIEAMNMAVKAGVPGSEETAWCLLQLGGLYERKGDLKSAEACFREALAQRANYAFAMAAIGRVMGKQKHYAEAEQQLKKATALMNDAGFHEELARIYKAEGKTELYAASVDSAEQALLGLSKGAEGHSHQVGLEMARFQFEFRDQLDLALANAEHEYTHRKDNIDVNALLAQLYFAKGDLAKARTHIELAKRTGSVDAALHCTEGLIALQENAAAGKALIAASLKTDPYLAYPLAAQARRSI